MGGPVQPELDALLEGADISSTEGLTRTLRAASLPASQRLALAWAMFDSSGGGGAHSDDIRRLSAMLVRKNELLAEWLFSSMLRELKSAKQGQHMLHRDPAAISLLVRVLESIGQSLVPGAVLDLRGVLQGPLMPLFFGAFKEGPDAGSARYVAQMAELWRFVVGSTADGLEMLSAQPDQLAQLLALVVAAYMGAESAESSELSDALREMSTLVAHTMRCACETSFNPRKMFSLFDEKLLPLCLQLACDVHSETRDGALDMLQAGLFHVECMGRLISALNEKQPASSDGEQNYAGSLFAQLTSALAAADADLRARYAAALPGLLARYLLAAALVCSETRSMAASTLGLSAVAANPLAVTRVEMGAACLGMFTYLYALLSPHCSDERVLAATNQLVRVYFGDVCFGTVRNTSALGSEVHQKQADALGVWLASLISPVLRDENAAASALVLVLQGVDLALDAGPDSVKAYSVQVLGALARVPEAAAEAGATVLSHLTLTLQKSRQLDSMVCSLAEIRAGLPAHGSAKRVNLLVAPAFLRELGQAVSQSMPHAQVAACLAALVDAIVAEAHKVACTDADAGEKGRKRRRLGDGRAPGSTKGPPCGGTIEVLAAVTAAFVLASVATVSTEHQRVLYSGMLAEKYDQLAAALAGGRLAWARLLLHYAFVETAAQMDGTERWLRTCTHPERVRSCVLPPDTTGSLDDADGPQIATLSMLVAFQAAAHWATFAASQRAGIIPDAVSAKVDACAASATAANMVSSHFPESCLALPFAAGASAAADAGDGPADRQQGWGPWNGQAHCIGESNFKRAQWRLLLDWLDLACEYADDRTMQRITMRLVAGFVVPATGDDSDDGGESAHALLESAGFFEMARVRETLAAALAECVLQMWQAHVSHTCGSSRPPKLYRKIAGAFESIATHAAAGVTAAADAFASIGGDTVKLVGAAEDLRDKHRLSPAQSAAWIQLVQSLLRFPVVYWGQPHAQAVLALALVADFGISSALSSDVDARTLRTLARALVGRLLQHTPALSADLLPCATRAIDHWTTIPHQSSELTECSQRVVCLTMDVLARSAFGQADKAAGSACRKACASLYGRFDTMSSRDVGSTGGFVLEALGAVARVAQQCAEKAQPRSGSDKWAGLLKPWLAQTSLRIAERLNVGSPGCSEDSQLTAGYVALYCTLKRLYTGATETSGDGDDNVDGDADLVRQVGVVLSSAAQLPGVLVLALVLYAIHGTAELGASAPGLLAYLTRFIADNGDADSGEQPFVRTMIAAIVGGVVQTGESLGDAVVGGAIEPLLRMLDEDAFASFFASCLSNLRCGGTRAAAASSQTILAFVRLGDRQDGGSGCVRRQRVVQRNVGSILSALHAHVCANRSLGAAFNALAIVNELAVASSARFAMFDVSESLAIISALTLMPPDVPAGSGGELAADLYCRVCRVLSGIVRRHTGLVLDSISLLVGILRSLLHAFVEPADTEKASRQRLDTAATPWVVACAPLPAQCAEAYSRVLNDLCRARRSDAPGGKQQRIRDRGAPAGEYVKMTRGTGASGVASVVAMYAPLILAEYCVIQSGGAALAGAPRMQADVLGKDSNYNTAFRGLSWRPVPVLSVASGTGTEPGATRGSIIASPALREALLPGWYALLDIMTGDDRGTLLVLLAGSSAVPSAFGPGRHDGAHEVLKALHQSYIDFYKFTGNV